LKRLPRTIITEEALKNYLSEETEKINLEHHYWIKDAFIEKIGRMAPNLRELSLRRMNICNKSFLELVTYVKNLRRIDISDCPNILSTGCRALIENNPHL